MPVKMIKKGMKGKEVRYLQELLLKNLKLNDSKFKIDGDFGNLTDKTTRKFQKKIKLSVDGKAGPATFGALAKKGDSKSRKFAESIAKKAPKEKDKTKTTLSKKDLEEISKDLKWINDFSKTIEDMGGTIPGPLRVAMKVLEKTVKTGVEVGKSCESAYKELRKYEKDLMDACKTVDDAMEWTCRAMVFRQWKQRGVNFTLDPENPKAVSADLIRKAIKTFTPSVICKKWERCAKLHKKK